MFMCIYEISTNDIVEFRQNSDVPQTTTAQQYFDIFCDNNNVEKSNFAFAELQFQKIELIKGKHIYDVQTNAIVVSPNWIEPPRVESSNIPVSGN